MQVFVISPLLARADWPDEIDSMAVFVFLTLVVAGPLLGYWLLVVDIRAYMRALRGALIRVRNHLPHLPTWARQETPGCLRSLGLELPCSEAEVKRAYHKLAETLHPDRGGDRQRFLLLQEQFETAILFVRENN